MHQFLATWEDEENNRQIQFTVDYIVENREMVVTGFSPRKVSFVCPETNTCLRSIGIHTDSGREALAERIRTSAQVTELVSEFARQNNMAVAV